MPIFENFEYLDIFQGHTFVTQSRVKLIQFFVTNVLRVYKPVKAVILFSLEPVTSFS